MEEVPSKLVLHWDQTGKVPTTSWTMNEVGARRVELIGLSEKRKITAVFCGSLVGRFLPVQLIYKGKTIIVTQLIFHQNGISPIHRSTGLMKQP